MSVSIYALIDPRDGATRYVGKTSGPLRTRLLAHINDVKRGRVYIPRHRWIAALIEIGRRPEIVALEVVDDAQWQEAEKRWIATLSTTCDLLNATAGGDGLSKYTHRPDTRERQSRSATERYKSQAERDKTGEAVSEAHSRPESKEKQRLRAAAFTPQHKANFRAGGNSYARSEEGRLASSRRFTGRVLSDETRRKISIARTGQKRTPESIEATASKLRGRAFTPERRAAISAGRRRQLQQVSA